jgi:hypothetical protein
MSNISNHFKPAKPAPTIDLSLADSGQLEDGKTYLATVNSAKFIHGNEERSHKIDLCLKLINPEGEQLGVLNTFLYVSPRAMKRLKNFLVAAEVVTEETSKQFKTPADQIPALVVNKLLGVRILALMETDNGAMGAFINTEPRFEVEEYLSATEAMETVEEEKEEKGAPANG